MSFHIVRPAEALSTDSAVEYIIIHVSQQVHFYLFGTGYHKVAGPAGIIIIPNGILLIMDHEMPGLTKNIAAEVALSRSLGYSMYSRNICQLHYWICSIIVFVMFCVGCAVWMSVKSVTDGWNVFFFRVHWIFIHDNILVSVLLKNVTNKLLIAITIMTNFIYF